MYGHVSNMEEMVTRSFRIEIDGLYEQEVEFKEVV